MLLGSMGMLSVHAQETSGRIVYEEQRALDIPQIEGIDSAMLAMFPKEIKTTKELFFNETAALYRNIPQPPRDAPMDGAGEGIVVRMDEPDDQVFTDFKSKTVTERRDFMSRVFLIEKPLETPSWKLTGNRKNILGYNCQEALVEDSLQKMTIWFAPELPLSAGPGIVNGFPGIVLGMEQDNGKLRLYATAIDKAPFDKAILTKPKDGKKISPEKFDEMVEKKRQEMQEQYGGDGNTVIRVIHK